ncbi:MAG: glutathione synthase [Pseudomonadota bacterium]
MRIGILMDPIEKIKPYKDTTFAMMLAAQKRGCELQYMELSDLFMVDGQARAKTSPITVQDNNEDWFSRGASQDMALGEMDVILMRKDPPFDMEYVYATYILERAQEAGALVVNHPQSLRDINEKAYTAWFPQCCPPTLISRSMSRIKGFVEEHGKIVVKPLDGMGGRSIFIVSPGDLNTNVILETITEEEHTFAMAQKFIPGIAETGDKRILVVNGEPVPYALARIPAEGESRGNLAAGGSSKGVPLTDRDRWLVQEIAPVLKKKGIYFAGLDVIGDYVTEINVTSPTCVRELDAEFGLDIAGDLVEILHNLLR